MIEVTNEKVAGFEPRWRRYTGFSLLFDNPGASLSPAEQGLRRLHTAVDENGLQLYRGLRHGLRQIGLDHLLNTYLLCPLAPHSYHVTVWDGLNETNAPYVTAAHRIALTEFLAQFPASFAGSSLFTSFINESALTSSQLGPIRFKFDTLANWANISLVATLVPDGPESAQAFEQIAAARHALYDRLETMFGVRGPAQFVPHVSLGYFANQDLAQLSWPHIDRWQQVMDHELAGTTVTFDSISLYGFRDMVAFFKRDAAPA